jgi:hypothetical protein
MKIKNQERYLKTNILCLFGEEKDNIVVISDVEYSSGQTNYFIHSKQELLDLFFEILLKKHDKYRYSFLSLSILLNISLEDVELYFLPDVLSNNEVVDVFLGYHFVRGENANKLIEKTIGLNQFFEKFIKDDLEHGLDRFCTLYGRRHFLKEINNYYIFS